MGDEFRSVRLIKNRSLLFYALHEKFREFRGFFFAKIHEIKLLRIFKMDRPRN